MNKMQTQLVELLKAAINGKKINSSIYENIGWENIIKESKAHKIEALIYSAISKESINNIDDEILELWKKETFMSGVNQIIHVKNVSEFLGKFNKENIPVIVLKGLVIRNLYPKPELRTMCDADIVVHKKNLDKVKSILLNLGYVETVISDKDICFIRGNTYVEVHWSIANENSFDNVDLFEKEMWKNTVKVNIGDNYALSMSDEDLLVHMCMHMASHIKYMGFGIRQLCDLVLMVEKRGNLINWNSFIFKVNKLGIYKCTTTLFEICNKLFGMEIPEEVNSPDKANHKYRDLFIEEIFLSGVHGKRDKASSFTHVLSYANNKEQRSIFKSFKKLYFPSSYMLSDKYIYAKKCKILLPIAWMHRFLVGILNNDYNLSEKVKIVLYGRRISKRRNKLVDWLEL